MFPRPMEIRSGEGRAVLLIGSQLFLILAGSTIHATAAEALPALLAAVRALERSDLLTIDRVDFLDLLETHTSMIRTFTRTIADRIATGIAA